MKRLKPRPEAGEASVEEIRATAMRLLARREHSIYELQSKLESRGYTAELVQQVLEQLVSERLLSDERFTESYVYYRGSRGRGPLRIRAELRERGVSDELISHHLEASELSWREQAEAARQKRFGKALPQEWNERSRQARFLQYRGFSSEQIRSLLDGDEFE